MAKRKLAVALTLLMAVSVFPGCSKAPEPAATNPPATEAPATQAPAAQADATPEAKTEPAANAGTFAGYPMNKQNETITWFSSESYKPNSAFASAEDSPFHKGLKEMLGVNIEWQFPTEGTTGAQAFNLMMASGTLPDVICHPLIKDSERYINEGTIWDLSPYIKDYSPAYYAWLQTNAAYDKAMKTDSGKYYGYGFFREDGGWNDTYLGPVVRTDWLEEQSLPLPETISDWDKTLKVFKEKYDATLSFAKSRVETTGISGAFGAYGMINYQNFIDSNKKVQLAHIQPEWRDYMAQLNKWWTEGILDQDFITDNDTIARTKALNGEMGLSITSMGQLSNWSKDADEAGNGAKWTGLQYPKGDDGKLSMVFGGPGVGTVAAVVSTSCPKEKLELVMRALDYAYTEEGNLYWNFGKQGVSWDYDADGKPAYLPIVTEDPNGLNNAIDKYGGSTWSGNCIQATLLLYLKNTPTAVAANDLWFYPNEPITSSWKMPNGVTFTPEESERAAELQNTIGTYCSEMAIKFITGEESLTKFDGFVSTVKDMGVEELLGINQAGYDRYLAR